MTITMLDLSQAAQVSQCGTYRYWLRRETDMRVGGNRLLFVMLNPSTADAVVDDPTIRRCVGAAVVNKAYTLGVVNLFAYRTAYKDELWTDKVVDPIGPDTDEYIELAACWADKIVFAFGAPPAKGWQKEIWMQRVASVEQIVLGSGKKPLAFKLTNDGWPRHPLYLRNGLVPQPWVHP